MRFNRVDQTADYFIRAFEIEKVCDFPCDDFIRPDNYCHKLMMIWIYDSYIWRMWYGVVCCGVVWCRAVRCGAE